MNAPFDLDDEDMIDVTPAPEGFVIDSEDKAAWAVDRLLQRRESVARVKQQTERNIRRAERELERARSFFEPLLEAWARANPPAKGRTVHLGTGDLAFKKEPGGVFVEDEDAVLAWAEQHLPEAISRSVTRKLDVARAKREGERILTEAINAEFAVLAMKPEAWGPATQEEADKATEELLARATAALPPGFVRRNDVDTFRVKGPKGGK